MMGTHPPLFKCILMPKRLIKVARELNVATATLVDFLVTKGFDIENKPTAKVTEEMEHLLYQEFQKDLAIKKEADRLVLGNKASTTAPAEEKTAPTSGASQEKTKNVIDILEEKFEQKKAQEAAKEKTSQKEEDKTPPAQKEEDEKPKVGLVIKGKVDLDALEKKKSPPKTKPAAKEKTAPKKEKTEKKQTAQEETASTEKQGKKEKTSPQEEQPLQQKEEQPTKKKEDETIKAHAPQLTGLKILGKINIEDKKTEPRKRGDKRPSKPVASSDGVGTGKRKRRRRTTTHAGRAGNKQTGGQKRKKEEVKEVISQKEIEEKIKETMASLKGGGKKKGQKLRRSKRERLREKQEQRAQSQVSEKLQVTEFVTVQELANLMEVEAADVITACMNMGVIVSINQRLEKEIIELVAIEFGHEVEFIDLEEQLEEEEEEVVDNPEDLVPRPPIITVMGHVDHGKTSLLDYIRQANVAAGESGGITQHIGAYEVEVETDEGRRKITFLDTPGHEAFTAMRARGAKVTDIAIIIIAADDSIMPQTREAISHAQSADVPIIFAINKIDKPGANPDRIKQELASMNLLIEEWGGEYQSQDISAKTGEGIPELLEKILLVADLMELKANPKRKAIGTVLEASLDKGRGYLAKLLVQNGTLRIGSPIVAGQYAGKIKALYNEWGQRLKEAGPSTPVLALGLHGAPQAGERFKEMETEQEARALANKRAQIAREQTHRATKRISLDEIGRRIALGDFKELNLIVKGDVDGSVEALADSFLKLSHETVQVNIIHKAVGQIVESDVLLASAADAIIIGFQVKPSLNARKLAERERVQIRTYSVIYEAIDEVKNAIHGMLKPTKEEKVLATLEVKEIFKIKRVGLVAGCVVQDGRITRDAKVRVIRNGLVIFPNREGVEGELGSLKRFQDDVKEVKVGQDCGLTIKNFNDIKVGDVIEAYEIIELKPQL